MSPDDRIAQLEAENRQLKDTLAAVKAALQEIRLAWVEERLGRADRLEALEPRAPILAWKRP